MKRIAIFVLLCVGVLTMTACACVAQVADFPAANNGVIELTQQVEITKDKTLENVTIKANISSNDNIVVKEGATLTLENVDIEAPHGLALWIYEKGKVIMKGGSIKHGGVSSDSGVYDLITVTGGGGICDRVGYYRD